MSKKLIAILLASSMALALAGCSIKDTASDFVSEHVTIVTDETEATDDEAATDATEADVADVADEADVVEDEANAEKAATDETKKIEQAEDNAEDEEDATVIEDTETDNSSSKSETENSSFADLEEAISESADGETESATDAVIATEYVLYQMDEGWETISHEDIVEQGLADAYYLRLFEDGSGLLCIDGIETVITLDNSHLYAEDGTVYEYTTSTDFFVIYLDDISTTLYLAEID